MKEPVDIEHSRRQNVLTITWDSGTVCKYPVAYLRGWCPCAGCQGHGPVARFQSVDDVSITHMEEVGAYALGLHFSDGHDTGIYTWDWLRRIAAESPPLGLKHGTFEDGRFNP